MISTAYISLYGKRVGAVVYTPETDNCSFEFDPKYISGGLNLAPIKMPLQNAQGRIFTFPELKNSVTFKGLPGLLADVLPDSFGNAVINNWLSAQGRPANSLNPVEMLCFIGKRGMGALEFEPAEPKGNNTASKIDFERMVALAGEILSTREKFSATLKEKSNKGLTEIIKIGTSAGGARAKAVIAYNEKTGEVRSGQAAAPKGYTHWLLKFDGVVDGQSGISSGYGRVEMAYHLMAKEAGIEMTECRLLQENNRAHFMTKRFDRIAGNTKLHTQSFCALAHYDFNNITSYSYEQLFEIIRRLQLPYADTEQLYLRMVFNVLARNCDDHTKNFSFLMDTTGKWRLAPAYDICFSYRPGSRWVSRQSLSINGKREDFTEEDFLVTAQRMGVKKPKQLIEQVQYAIAQWKRYAKQTDVPKKLIKMITPELLLKK